MIATKATHLDLDETADDEDYYFDHRAADRACAFIESLCHTSGPLAGQRFVLAPWQRTHTRNIFGWKRKSDDLRRFQVAYIEVPRKNGKALAIDTPIPTPSGWTAMGDLKVGDYVFDHDGKPVRIKAAFDVMHNRKCYRVTFSDGESIICDAEHLWETEPRRTGRPGPGECKGIPKAKWSHLPRQQVFDTEQIRRTLTVDNYHNVKNGRVEWNHKIKVCGALETDALDLPIEPYTLGVWLGDGNSSSAAMTCGESDCEAMLDNLRASGTPTTLLGRDHRNSACRVSIGRGYLQKRLRKEGLLGNKHIPDIYQRASLSQRIALLQGLMDTDGHCSKVGQCEFTTVSPRLRDGFIELVRGLGFKPGLKTARATLNGRDCGEKYRIHFYAYKDRPVFRLKRKADRLKPTPRKPTRASYRQIVAVDEVPSVPVRCIAVDSERQLYLAGRGMIPTHNTTWAAAIALYMTFADGEVGGQVYSAAKDLEQACLCYDTAVTMAEEHPFLSAHAVIRKMPKSITHAESRTKYKPLAGKSVPGTGFSPSGIIFDELHEQSDRILWDKLQSGRGARAQPLTVALTTAGFDRSSICWTLHKKARDMLDGHIEDDKFYPVIYAADEEDDWTDPAVWRKANPNFGESMRDDYLSDEFETTKTEPEYKNTFKRWYLNLWTGQDKNWLNVHEWDSGKESLDLWKEFEGHECWCGLDLSNVRDATAFVMVFHDHRFTPVDGRRRYVALPTIWTPREPGTKRDAQDMRQLQNWAEKGWVRTDAGEKDISMDAMEQHIAELRERYSIRDIAFDPYHARGLVEALESRGFEMTKFAQTAGFYTQGCKELEVLLGRGDLRHDGNECMRWMVGNAAKREDSSGNIKPDKGASGDKIDGVVALIMGLSLAMRENQGSIYEEQGVGSF